MPKLETRPVYFYQQPSHWGPSKSSLLILHTGQICWRLNIALSKRPMLGLRLFVLLLPCRRAFVEASIIVMSFVWFAKKIAGNDYRWVTCCDGLQKRKVSKKRRIRRLKDDVRRICELTAPNIAKELRFLLEILWKILLYLQYLQNENYIKCRV